MLFSWWRGVGGKNRNRCDAMACFSACPPVHGSWDFILGGHLSRSSSLLGLVYDSTAAEGKQQHMMLFVSLCPGTKRHQRLPSSGPAPFTRPPRPIRVPRNPFSTLKPQSMKLSTSDILTHADIWGRSSCLQSEHGVMKTTPEINRP